MSPATLGRLGLVSALGHARRALANEDAPPIFYSRPDNLDGDFDDVDDASVDEAFARWNEEVEASRRIEASFASLDEMVHQPQHDADLSLRWVMVHLIEEYSRHNGHADFLREQIDGATGE